MSIATIEIADKKYEIRTYRPEDEKKVLQLWNLAFENEFPYDLWRWKYFENPYGYDVLICVNEEGKTVVLFGGFPYRSNYRGNPATLMLAADIMSHPEYRKTGLFIKTAFAYFDYFGKPGRHLMLYGFPGRYHFDIGEKYLGYKALSRPVAYAAGKTAEISTRGRSDIELVRMDDIDGRFDDLWTACQNDYPLCVIRDRRFVQWRFMDHPRNAYEVWGGRRANDLGIDAYAVMKIDNGRSVIVDIFGVLDPKILSGFVISMADMLKKRDIPTMETWLPSHHLMMTSAVKAGLSINPEPLGIISTMKLFDHSPDFDWVSDHLYYTMADADLF